MKNYYLSLFYTLIISYCVIFTGCSKESNPLTNNVITSSDGMLVFERSSVDSITKYGLMVPKRFNQEFDYTNSDSLIFTFTANTKQTSNNSLTGLIFGVDSGGVTLMDLRIFADWKTGNFDYRVSTPSPKRKFSFHKYFITCSVDGEYLAIRNLKIWKK
jgi:hypothetical protein